MSIFTPNTFSRKGKTGHRFLFIAQKRINATTDGRFGEPQWMIEYLSGHRSQHLPKIRKIGYPAAKISGQFLSFTVYSVDVGRLLAVISNKFCPFQ